MARKETLEAIKRYAEDLGWKVLIDYWFDGEITFSKRSPSGEDFSFTVDSEFPIGAIGYYWNLFEGEDDVEQMIYELYAGLAENIICDEEDYL